MLKSCGKHGDSLVQLVKTCMAWQKLHGDDLEVKSPRRQCKPSSRHQAPAGGVRLGTDAGVHTKSWAERSTIATDGSALVLPSRALKEAQGSESFSA